MAVASVGLATVVGPCVAVRSSFGGLLCSGRRSAGGRDSSCFPGESGIRRAATERPLSRRSMIRRPATPRATRPSVVTSARPAQDSSGTGCAGASWRPREAASLQGSILETPAMRCTTGESSIAVCVSRRAARAESDRLRLHRTRLGAEWQPTAIERWSCSPQPGGSRGLRHGSRQAVQRHVPRAAAGAVLEDVERAKPQHLPHATNRERPGGLPGAGIASMVNAMARAVHAVHRDNVVIAGGLAPFGGDINDPSGGQVGDQERIHPLEFMRKLLCMSDGREAGADVQRQDRVRRLGAPRVHVRWADAPCVRSGRRLDRRPVEDAEASRRGRGRRHIRTSQKLGVLGDRVQLRLEPARSQGPSCWRSMRAGRPRRCTGCGRAVSAS